MTIRCATGASRIRRKSLLLLLVVALLTAACAGADQGSGDGAADGGTPGETTAETAAGDGVAAVQGVTDDEILIGSFGPVTGPASFIGTASRDGMALAFDEINAAGGINGRELRLVFEGAADAAESVAVGKRLVEEEQVAVLVLGSGSTGAAAVADYVREQGIPSFNIVGATPTIREPFAENVFHGVAPAAADAAKANVQMVLNELEESGVTDRNIAVVSGTFEYAAATHDAILPRLEEAGFTVVEDLTFDLGDEDFSAQINRIKNSDAQAVLNITQPVEGQRFLRQARSLALDLPIFVDQAAVTFELLEAGEAAEGVRGLLIIPYFFGADAQPMTTFEERFAEAYPDVPATRPNYIDIIGYGDGYVLAKVLQDAGDDLSWENIISTWESQEGVVPSDLGGVDVIFPESYGPEDHQGNSRVAIMEVQDGQWVTIDEVDLNELE